MSTYYDVECDWLRLQEAVQKWWGIKEVNETDDDDDDHDDDDDDDASSLDNNFLSNISSI